MTRRLIALLATLTMSVAGLADNTLNVSATVVGSVLLTVDAAGQTTSGSGAATVTSSLGSMSSLQSAPAGFALVRNAGQATLSSTITARALKANMTSSSYTLMAQLQRPLPRGVAWKVNGVAVSNASASAVATDDFSTIDNLSWTIVADASAGNASIDNAIVFTVVPK